MRAYRWWVKTMFDLLESGEDSRLQKENIAQLVTTKIHAPGGSCSNVTYQTVTNSSDVEYQRQVHC